MNESNFSTGSCYVNVQGCKGRPLGYGELEKAQCVQVIKTKHKTMHYLLNFSSMQFPADIKNVKARQ